MKTPKFWQTTNFISNILYPAGMLYGWLTKMRMLRAQKFKVSKPVICVGNITAGGTGKTPVAISLATLLKAQGYNPFFVSRGYKGKLNNIIVDPKTHSASDVGDEPMLLCKTAPVVINSDRYAGAKLAISKGADIIILDDGFQNPKLIKDLSFVVFDGSFGLGNNRCIPSGPLREKWYRGLRRADGIIIIGQDKTNLAQKIHGRPIFLAEVEAKPTPVKNNKVIAFAGIGRPSKLYESLASLGYDVIKTYDFEDHHAYSSTEINKIITEAQKENAEIFTTTKDYVKIPAPFQEQIHALEIQIKWQNLRMLTQFILQKIQ